MDSKRRGELARFLVDLVTGEANETLRMDTTVITLGAIITEAERAFAAVPVPMLIYCPECGARHIDEGEFATKVHHTHSCQTCGLTWRPAVVPTDGVRFLPGFKNEVSNG
jgi:predicted RNA-binding Zn-ribbon protein involved in translation (DUF1610 family)